MYIKECPHCSIEKKYKNHQQYGAHVTNCNKNPNYKIRLKKIKESLKKIPKNKKYSYVIKCKNKNCKKEFELFLTKNNYNKDRYKKFCSYKCSSSYSTSFIDKNELKKSKCIDCGSIINIKKHSNHNTKCDECKLENINKNEYYRKKNKICKNCGRKECKNKTCKSFNGGRKKTFTKLGFDNKKIGNSEFNEEYDRIVNLLEEEYKSNSLIEIGEKYNINYQTIQSIMKSLSIKRRDFSDSMKLAIFKGRYTFPEVTVFPYKSGKHKTWEDNEIWYRSSYELEYCEYLDKNKIKYEVESIRIEYWDSQLNKNRISIPDFYLPETNDIIEIKSTWTYDEQNMKDKFKSYKHNGYNTILILDKKETKIN